MNLPSQNISLLDSEKRCCLSVLFWFVSTLLDEGGYEYEYIFS